MSIELPDKRGRRERRARFDLLRDWYGEEYARTEITAHTGKPRSIADVMDIILDDMDDPVLKKYAELTNNWSDCCGEALAQWLTPAGIRDGVLTLTVPHSGLISIVNPSIDLIRASIVERFGTDFCCEIRVITGSSSRRKRSKPQ